MDCQWQEDQANCRIREFERLSAEVVELKRPCAALLEWDATAGGEARRDALMFRWMPLPAEQNMGTHDV